MKKIAIVASAMIVVTAFSGCDGGKTTSNSVERDGKITYPVANGATLTYWCPMPVSLGDLVKNFGETDFAKELEKRTGIKVNYIHPISY